MEKTNKKGEVGAVAGLVLGVGVAVIVLLLVSTLGGQTYQLTEADIDAVANHPVTGESLTIINGTADLLNNQDIQSDTLKLYNGSNVLGLGNFTIDYSTGSVLLKTTHTLGLAYNNTAVSANYTWGRAEVRESVKSSIVSSFNGLEQTGTYLPLVVLAVIISMVLALVLGLGATRGGSGNGSAL